MLPHHRAFTEIIEYSRFSFAAINDASLDNVIQASRLLEDIHELLLAAVYYRQVFVPEVGRFLQKNALFVSTNPNPGWCCTKAIYRRDDCVNIGIPIAVPWAELG